MAQAKLESNTRDKSGKGVARKLRAAGRVPGILYGPTRQPLGLDLLEKSVAELISKHGLNPIITLSIGTESHVCMIKEVQRDVFQQKILHLDLRQIDMKEKIEVNVRVILEGEEAVRATGAIVEQTVRSVKVKTTPSHIPETFHVDISDVRPGGKVPHVSDIPMPPGAELADHGETPVVHVFAPRGAAEAAAAE